MKSKGVRTANFEKTYKFYATLNSFHIQNTKTAKIIQLLAINIALTIVAEILTQVQT
jgi:hypothetical protein